MSKTLLFETKSVLAELRFLRRSVYNQSRRFSDCEQFTMTNSFHKGSAKEQYYLKQKGSPGRVYIGTGKAKTVRRIKTSRYYNKLLQVIDNDIKLLERVDQEYILPDHSSVNNMLPKVYRSDDITEIMPGTRTAAEWKKEKEAENSLSPGGPCLSGAGWHYDALIIRSDNCQLSFIFRDHFCL